MSQDVFKQFMELMKPFMKSHGFAKKIIIFISVIHKEI